MGAIEGGECGSRGPRVGVQMFCDAHSARANLSTADSMMACVARNGTWYYSQSFVNFVDQPELSVSCTAYIYALSYVVCNINITAEVSS